MSFGASARPTQRVRRIGVLMGLAADDPESQARLAAFAQGLQQAGWTVGQNIRIDYRWGAGNADVMRKHGAELAASSPDVILAHSSAAVAPLLQEGPGQIADITGADLVSDQREHDGMVRLLKEIAPNVKRVAVLRESFVLPARDNSARSRPLRIR